MNLIMDPLFRMTGKGLLLGLFLVLTLVLTVRPSIGLSQTLGQNHGNSDSNKLELTTLEVPGATWPKITIKGKIKADALSCVALYLALDYQKNYVPNMLESIPMRHIKANQVETYYEQKMPWPLSNSHYISGTILEPMDPKNLEYKVKIYQAYNPDLDDFRGYVTFAPLPDGTLWTYETFVRPKSFFAGILKKIYKKELLSTSEEIKSFIELTVKNNPKLTEFYRQIIIRTQVGELAYQKVIDANAQKILQIKQKLKLPY